MAIKYITRLLVLAWLVVLLLPSWSIAAEQGAESKTVDNSGSLEKPLDYVAIVGNEKIKMGFYIAALRRGMRDKFYHGKIPEEEARLFRQEVAEQLIERVLLVREAKRQNVQVDAEKVESAVQKFDAKFKDDAEWAKAREQVLAELRIKLRGDSLAKQLKELIHSVPEPTDKEVLNYYNENKNLFTTPERVSISLIMLRVDPSSGSDVWQQANVEAVSILERINSGADFAELARIHSSDESAQNGGDMGFVHAGMLGVNAQKVLDILEPGEVSAPVILLEGVSIFRLDEREAPRLNDFKSVKERAIGLLKRETGKKNWEELLVRLHSETRVVINDAPWR